MGYPLLACVFLEQVRELLAESLDLGPVRFCVEAHHGPSMRQKRLIIGKWKMRRIRHLEIF